MKRERGHWEILRDIGKLEPDEEPRICTAEPFPGSAPGNRCRSGQPKKCDFPGW